MIVCRIELWPKGDGAKAREVGRVEIVNIGGTAVYGDYEVRIPKSPEYAKRRGLWKWGLVEGFPRKRLGPQDLLLRALAACLGKRNPEAAALVATEPETLVVEGVPSVADEEDGGAGRPLLVLPAGLPADEVAFLQRVARERVEQIRRHGHTPENDDRYVEGELGKAAAAYLSGEDYGAVLYPWRDHVLRHFRRAWSGTTGQELMELVVRFITRKPRLDQLAVGMALGLAEAGRRLRAGEG